MYVCKNQGRKRLGVNSPTDGPTDPPIDARSLPAIELSYVPRNFQCTRHLKQMYASSYKTRLICIVATDGSTRTGDKKKSEQDCRSCCRLQQKTGAVVRLHFIRRILSDMWACMHVVAVFRWNHGRDMLLDNNLR